MGSQDAAKCLCVGINDKDKIHIPAAVGDSDRVESCLESVASNEMILEMKEDEIKFNYQIYSGKKKKARLGQNWQTKCSLFIPIWLFTLVPPSWFLKWDLLTMV